jgi:hypothetical protein
MTASGRHATAIALRRLAQAGYTSLEQVDNTSDWVLLAIRGIRAGRLGHVRRLCRPEWQPPSSQAIRASNWFMSATQHALRYWSPETLASVLRGSAPTPSSAASVDERLALDVFAQAARHAQRYCRAVELIQALRQASNTELEHMPLSSDCDAIPDDQPGEADHAQVETTSPDPAPVILHEGDAVQDSDHFAHPRHKRIEIVRRYWLAREKREIQNKDAWARSHYQITGKTLLSYEREFQDQREAILASAESK